MGRSLRQLLTILYLIVPWKPKATSKMSLQILAEHIKFYILAKFQSDIFVYIEKSFSISAGLYLNEISPDLSFFEERMCLM